jgi:hypothetical protein
MSGHAAGNGDSMQDKGPTSPKAAMDLFALLHNLKVRTPLHETPPCDITRDTASYTPRVPHCA